MKHVLVLLLAISPAACRSANPDASTLREAVAVTCEGGLVNARTINPDWPNDSTCVLPAWNGELSTECSQEIAAECAMMQTDQCNVLPSGGHDCVCIPPLVKANTINASWPNDIDCVLPTWNGVKSDGCKQESAALCDSGQVDECTILPSGSHDCVSFPPAAEPELTVACRPGLVNARTINPAWPNDVTCVLPGWNGQLSNDCSQEVAAECAMFQTDQCSVLPSGSHDCVCAPPLVKAKSINSSWPNNIDCVLPIWSGVKSTSCSQENAAVCDEGETDQCAILPSGHHTCVTDPTYP